MQTALDISWVVVKICWFGVLAAIAIRFIIAIIFDK